MPAPAATKSQACSARGVSNREFLRSLGTALVSLILSAALLIVGYATFSPRLAELESAAIRPDAKPWTFRGSDLIPRMGQGVKTENNGLRVTKFDQGIDNRAIFTRRASLKASNYPFLDYTIKGNHTGLRIYLIWRTEAEPDKTYNTPLLWTGKNSAVVDLAKIANWRGTVTEIGLDIYRDFGNRMTVIEQFTLTPVSALDLLKSIWGDWYASQTWTHRSINVLYGTIEGKGVSPTVSFSAWTLLSILAVALIQALTRHITVLPYCIVILIPWIILDGIWQSRLNRQLEKTTSTFGGLSQTEKHLANFDSELYAYAKRLKHQVFPAESKIFLIHNSVGHDLQRLRLQFHLLPLNVYNFGTTPPKKFLIQKDDYILALGAVPSLKFEQDTSTLHWNEWYSAKASIVDKTSMGTIYRVTAK